MKQLLSNKDYHAHAAIGSTTLKAICKTSVLHAMERPFNPSAAMILGTAVHTAIFEPETFVDEYLVSPKFDRRTKAGKEGYANFQEMALCKTVINDEQMSVIGSMKQSIMSHPIANTMITGGDAELSFFTTCPETGLELKCRPDYVKDGALIDLKTCQDASARGFAKSCADLMYHVQAAFYLDVYNLKNGATFNEFYFLAVESSAPHGIGIYKLETEAIEYGRIQYKEALRKLKEYLIAKELGEIDRHAFSYSNEIININLPAWVYNAQGQQ